MELKKQKMSEKTVEPSDYVRLIILSVTLCTDNRLVSHTTVCDEIEKALQAFTIEPDHLKDIIIYGFKRSFMALPYARKREYVRELIDYYEALEKKFSVSI